MGKRCSKGCARAQVSIEYLLVVGIMFIIVIPIFYYAMRESTDQIRWNQAEDAVTSLAKTADSVYALGPGSRDYVEVTIPSGVSGSYANNNDVVLMLDMSGGPAEIAAFSRAVVTGTIPTQMGTYHLPVEMLDSGIVKIGYGNDTIAPVIVYTYPNGRITFNDITMKANSNEPALCRYDAQDKEYTGMTGYFAGSLMNHESYLGVLADGNYVYYARCIDTSKNVMNSSAVINFTINSTATAGNQTNETYEDDPPIIVLVSPDDSYADNDSIVLFQYNATDASTISFCELIMNSTVMELATSISRNQTNSITKAGLEYGYYEWSINCTDVHGNEGSSAPRSIFINYVQDHDLPVVYLMAPADNTVRNYWLVMFSYNTTDTTSAIAYCTLHMNGTMDDGNTLSWNIIDSTITENILQSMTIPLFRANYVWQVSCTDSSYNANKGYSEKRNLRVNVTAGEEAFLNSCAGWCGWQSMSSGKCENSEQKCANNCGLPYSPNHNCYAGSSVSLQYCTGGSESDTCCCIL